MASGPLGIHPALRPWYGAGLRYVYLDDEAFTCLADEREKSFEQDCSMTMAKPMQGSVEGGPRYADRTPPQGRPVRQTAQPSTGQTAGEGGSFGRPPWQTEQSPQARQSSQLRQTPSAGQEILQRNQDVQSQQGPQASELPPEQWPQVWQSCLASTLSSAKGAPVLWTYWALGEDLSGAPNAPRRDILRHILGELNLPRGTHCFWPIAMPSTEPAVASQGIDIQENINTQSSISLEANAPIFLAGLNILSPRVCVVMGSKALKTILPNTKTGPFQQTQYGRMLFLVLPDMDMLLDDNERIPRVVAYLRTALQPFMARR